MTEDPEVGSDAWWDAREAELPQLVQINPLTGGPLGWPFGLPGHPQYRKEDTREKVDLEE
jgi:hypothetical protein